jgi:hypothetical protein
VVRGWVSVADVFTLSLEEVVAAMHGERPGQAFAGVQNAGKPVGCM